MERHIKTEEAVLEIFLAVVYRVRAMMAFNPALKSYFYVEFLLGLTDQRHGRGALSRNLHENMISSQSDFSAEDKTCHAGSSRLTILQIPFTDGPFSTQ